MIFETHIDISSELYRRVQPFLGVPATTTLINTSFPAANAAAVKGYQNDLLATYDAITYPGITILNQLNEDFTFIETPALSYPSILKQDPAALYNSLLRTSGTGNYKFEEITFFIVYLVTVSTGGVYPIPIGVGKTISFYYKNKTLSNQ